MVTGFVWGKVTEAQTLLTPATFSHTNPVINKGWPGPAKGQFIVYNHF